MELVDYLLLQYGVKNSVILDPFAGTGTALFGSAPQLRREAIEVLPIGQAIIEMRHLAYHHLSESDKHRIGQWIESSPWNSTPPASSLNELQITKGAYPSDTVEAISKFLTAIELENQNVRAVLFFALLCILESISYTRKDGQYLRWDWRAERRLGAARFDKGRILPFKEAITNKLSEILCDLGGDNEPGDLFESDSASKTVILHKGSCLKVLPNLPASHYDAIVTSPPYCNRYDYTRTYALELALMGVGEVELKNLRQSMLSCTVENRAKDLMKLQPAWRSAIEVVNQQELIQSILDFLESSRERGMLNNNGIARMVRGYFYEMACVLQECHRVLKSGAPLIMVNDNVRYAGVGISADLILSDFAEKLGFTVEEILILPTNKGNSSQQMGVHGRSPLRKCIYVWRKS